MYLIAVLLTCLLGGAAAPVLLPLLSYLAKSMSIPMFLLSLMLGTVIIYQVVMVAVLATLVGLSRGRKALGYASFKECMTFGNWMWDSWNYRNGKGRQEGFRFFGLEVAVRGQIV